MGKSKLTQATSISSETYYTVKKRDGGRCIYCGTPHSLQCAHFISRSQLGKGVPENLAMLCVHCHTALDNGNDTGLRTSIKNRFESYLRAHYDNWSAERLVYHKGDDI